MKKSFSNEKRAEIYLELAKKYDTARLDKSHKYACGVCPDFVNDYDADTTIKQRIFHEWWLFKPQYAANFDIWWDEYSPERILALLFSHQMAKNP